MKDRKSNLEKIDLSLIQDELDSLLNSDKELVNSDEKQAELILFNDEENTFEHIIVCLVDHCMHTYEQAEQCALVAHHKGESVIKTGEQQKIKKMYDRLTKKELTLEIRICTGDI